MSLNEIIAIANMLYNSPFNTKKPKDRIAVEHAKRMDERIRRAKECNNATDNDFFYNKEKS